MYGWRELHEGGYFNVFEDYSKITGATDSALEYRDYDFNEYMEFNKLPSVDNVTSTVNFPTIIKESSEWYDANTPEEISKFRKAVKNHIINNGSLYAVIDCPDYMPKANAFFSVEGEPSRGLHAISIVGWDDNFDKVNFKSHTGKKPSNNGAYIALNSWGTGWGNKGYFY
ncbi:C1 family peptidase, partial [Treponema sp. R6D11]